MLFERNVTDIGNNDVMKNEMVKNDSVVKERVQEYAQGPVCKGAREVEGMWSPGLAPPLYLPPGYRVLHQTGIHKYTRYRNIEN